MDSIPEENEKLQTETLKGLFTSSHLSLSFLEEVGLVE